MSKDAASTENRLTILATALALEKAHGRNFAASYLLDAGIAAEVVVELLYGPAVERTKGWVGTTAHRKQRGPAAG
jgi:hypothetical protein